TFHCGSGFGVCLCSLEREYYIFRCEGIAVVELNAFGKMENVLCIGGLLIRFAEIRYRYAFLIYMHQPVVNESISFARVGVIGVLRVKCYDVESCTVNDISTHLLAFIAFAACCCCVSAFAACRRCFSLGFCAACEESQKHYERKCKCYESFHLSYLFHF